MQPTFKLTTTVEENAKKLGLEYKFCTYDELKTILEYISYFKTLQLFRI